jgi:hypothetical protein
VRRLTAHLAPQDLRITSRRRVVHQVLNRRGQGRGCVLASMIAQSVGCSLGCSHSQFGKPVNPLLRGGFRLRRRGLRPVLVAFVKESGPVWARAVDHHGHLPTAPPLVARGRTAPQMATHCLQQCTGSSRQSRHGPAAASPVFWDLGRDCATLLETCAPVRPHHPGLARRHSVRGGVGRSPALPSQATTL